VSSKKQAVAGPRRVEYDEVRYCSSRSKLALRSLQLRENARYHEKRASFIAAQRQNETNRMQELTQQLQVAHETMEAMRQERLAWEQQMRQRDDGMEVEQEGLPGNDDDTEAQMIAQLLQFENEIDTLRNANRRLVSDCH
jgi:hypothetical protein